MEEKIIEFIISNHKVRIRLSKIIAKILPELQQEATQWFNTEGGIDFIDYLEKKYDSEKENEVSHL